MKKEAVTPHPLFAAFKTDSTMETDGILLRYPGFEVKVARAGGANKAFGKLFESRISKPYARQMKMGTMDDDLASQLMAEVYHDTILIKGTCRAQDAAGKWHDNSIPTADGKIVDATRANVVKLFSTDLAELFRDIQGQAGDFANYRQMDMEEAAGN